MQNNISCQLITITENDTLASILNQYKLTQQQLQALNQGIDLNNLTVGQKLCIPQLKKSLPCPIGSIPYTIKPGDNLYDLAASFYTTEETILKNNPTIDPNNLQIDQVICINQQKPEVPYCPSMNIYVVNDGDTPYLIASKFGITLNQLLDVNPGIDPNNLQIGQVICLPFTPTPYIIVVNRSIKTLDLYYLGKYVKTYPVAVGKPSTPTPAGNFYIMNKQVNPGGPFGTRWMGLSQPHYGIHGTNRPDSIGTAASNGCIRMHNEDVQNLFSLVSVNTPVNIL